MQPRFKSFETFWRLKHFLKIFLKSLHGTAAALRVFFRVIEDRSGSAAVQAWYVEGIITERHGSSTVPQPDITFTIQLRRGSLFYVVNLIFPCFLIFFVSFLGFFLSLESGDKVSFQTNILLALVVFMLTVDDTMPPTPKYCPLIGTFHSAVLNSRKKLNYRRGTARRAMPVEIVSTAVQWYR